MPKRKLMLLTLMHFVGFSTFAFATQVGVAADTRLTRYDGTYTIAKDGIVVSDLEVHGNIIVEARNVTVKNVKLVSKTRWHALQLSENAFGFTLQDSEIDGAGGTVNAVYGFGKFLRNNIHDVENGINVIGPSVIRDNVIHSLRGGDGAHYDGIEINGGHDIDITGNTITNPHHQTSTIMLNNYFSGLSNITIKNNQLIGGGYSIYIDGRFEGGAVDDDSIWITDNRIGGGAWGNFALYGHTPQMRGNTDLNNASSPEATEN